jgi:hypothetical protein
MQSYLLTALSVVCVCSASAPVVVGLTVNPQVTDLLSQFPAGGEDLRVAVVQSIETDPSLIDEVAFAARTATPSQKAAMDGGLASAASCLAKCDTGRADGEQRVVSLAQ